VLEPDQWTWSSYRHYAYGEAGPVLVNEPRTTEMRVKKSPELGSSGSHASNPAKRGATGLVVIHAGNLGQPPRHTVITITTGRGRDSKPGKS
jgi:hypothetical protein